MKPTKSFLFLIFILSFGMQIQAQKYGGSSYAHVKNNKGETRVVTNTTPCVWDTETKAKEKLEPIKFSNEEYDSQIFYDINSCSPSDKKKYGGSSSVRVRNKKGDTRIVTNTTPCVWNTIAQAKEKLQPIKSYNEEFITSISYDIDNCD